ncbi:restriction endonuclease subunit S [Phascolarctobacterium faecium]|uniref:restriction endonuclease subunit S n=1 Tax=Phascolarctobacterium faecium TaxID=33025 RepID=UPI0034608937
MAWELRKLGEVGSVSMCRRIFKDQTSESGDIPFYKIGTFGGEPDAFISIELFEEYKVKYPYPKKGDILISASGSIGRIVEFMGKNEYFQDSNIVWLNHDERLDNTFLKCFYSVVKWAGIEGSTIKRLYNDNILNTVINLPTIEEQQKIGAHFEQLDRLITLHQRKLDRMKELKKAFLDLIFSQKLRFEGFTDSWELRKLGEVVTRVQGNDGRMNLPTLTISASSGWLDQRDRFSSNIAGNEQKNYTLLKKGELSYNHGNSKLAKYGTVFVLRNSQEALVPRVYHSFKTTLLSDADFIEYMFSTKNPDRELAKLISSGARMDGLLNISYDDFIGIKISLPYKVEQQKIALFFRSIDNLIAIRQEKINQLTKLKTTFLKNMFI